MIIIIIMNRCVLALSAILASTDGSSELCIIKLIGNLGLSLSIFFV